MTDQRAAARRRQLIAAQTRPTVRILPASQWGLAERRAVDRLAAIDPFRVIGPYLDAAGLMPEGGFGVDVDPSWTDVPDGLMAGTYLSACALAIATGAVGPLLDRLRLAVDLLTRCQAQHARAGQHDGCLTAVPPERLATLLAGGTAGPADQDVVAERDQFWHETAALLVGLLDVARYAPINCRPCATRMGVWVATLTTPQREASSDGRVNSNSWWSTVASALAELAMATGRHRAVTGAARTLRDAAPTIELDRPLREPEQVARAIDDAIGAMSLFVLGDDTGFDTARGLWDRLMTDHVGPDGAVRVRGDSFGVTAPDQPADGGCEVGQLTVRMIELTMILQSSDADTEYADYLDRAGSNYLAATAAAMPQEGVASEVPFGAAVRMDRCHAPGSMCELNSLLTLLRLRQAVFTLRGDELTINLITPASLAVPGSGGVAVSRRHTSRYVVDILGDVPGRMQLRWPEYASAMWLRIDDVERPAAADPDGYVAVPGVRLTGESVEVEFDWSVEVVRATDDPSRFAILYGPWLMVALTDQADWLRWSPQALEAEFVRRGPNGPWRLDGIPLAPLRVVGDGVFHSMFLDIEA